MKAYTNLEQSKKLTKILSIESADMAWYPSFAKDGYSIRMLNDTYPLDIIGDAHDEIPAWSLTALLSILPEETRLLKSATDNTYHCDCPKGNIDKWFDNPVDACVEMIVKLKERDLL